MFAGNFAPHGWAFCDGQQVSIESFPALYAAIGSTYGGDGKRTFALPDMRGRVPVHRGKSLSVGDAGGSELADLGADHVPVHAHTGATAGAATPATHGTRVSMVVDPRPVTSFVSEGFTSAAGGDNAHENMQPFLSLHFIIALSGDAEPVSLDDPFIGEVRIFAGRNVPPGWKRCDGQVLEISDHPELFSVVGTTYGGYGNTFALPDLRSRVALHAGQGEGLTLRRLGESGGDAEVALTESHLPYHAHSLSMSGASGTMLITAGASGIGQMASDGVPHNNMQPYLAVQYLIATRGTSAD